MVILPWPLSFILPRGVARWVGHARLKPPKEEPLISVIVPVRNEENTIARNCCAVSNVQEYRNFEVIIVNDDSEDETLWMVSQSEMANVRVIHNPGKGKKAAITAGVRAARGSIIVTTDADCTVLYQRGSRCRSAQRFRDPPAS